MVKVRVIINIIFFFEIILKLIRKKFFFSLGNAVYAQSADLVCTAPFPCMPIYFHNDTPSHDLYRSAYFSTYSGVWYHGDFIFINPNTGGVIMLGRSDGTLNPG